MDENQEHEAGCLLLLLDVSIARQMDNRVAILGSNDLMQCWPEQVRSLALFLRKFAQFLSLIQERLTTLQFLCNCTHLDEVAVCAQHSQVQPPFMFHSCPKSVTISYHKIFVYR